MTDIDGKATPIDEARYRLYSHVLAQLEAEREAWGSGDDGEKLNIDAVMRSLDALYVLGGRVITGPVDGIPG